jgi:MFS family permease
VTLLFATYTLLVTPAVLVFGPLSVVKDRRELLIAAIVVADAAAGLFATAQGVVLLFVAQAVQAMALGASKRPPRQRWSSTTHQSSPGEHRWQPRH